MDHYAKGTIGNFSKKILQYEVIINFITFSSFQSSIACIPSQY